MKKIWNQLFLEERPSIMLSFFRLFVGFTVLAVMLPTFIHIQDTYLPTAFKEFNSNFFPIWMLEYVQHSPQWLIVLMIWVLSISGVFFLIGLFTQLSCIVMTLSCYYFYALNSFAMGTLSWDILLVTLFLMCLTPYAGDYFSVDALRQQNELAYKKTRPIFLQRLLQVQVAFTFFFTGLHKITVEGNWITNNPIYYLMNYPPQSVTKDFILKDVLQHMPEVCYIIGLGIVATELLMPLLLWWRKTRVMAIILGAFFHLALMLTLDVPATFFFLFPAQLLLFINSDEIVKWIEKKQLLAKRAPRALLFYDGKCGFCRSSIKTLKVMDVFHQLEYVDVHQVEHLSNYHNELTVDAVKHKLHLLEPEEILRSGYFVLRSLCWKMPMMFLIFPILYFPGSGLIGPAIYSLVAKYRYRLLGFNNKCGDEGACSIDA